MIVTKQNVIDICKNNIDLSLLSGNNNTLCIDGTSCTKKSSILRATNRNVSKISQIHTFRNPDTYFPSLMGYICTGMNTLTCGGPHFNDRSPLNVLDWNLLWLLLNDFLMKFSNVRPDINNEAHTPVLELYKSMILNYKEAYYRQMFAKKINCIVFVDSDLDRCDELHYMRGESSDKERASWKHYTFLQNLMYTELYPGLYIDMANFGNAETNVIIEGVAEFLNQTLDYLVETRKNVDATLMPSCKLATKKCDYNLINMSTHVYRSIGRWGCRYIQNDYNPEISLSSYIPSYLHVSKINHPNGGNHVDILPKNIDHLLQQNNDIVRDYIYDDWASSGSENNDTGYEDTPDDELSDANIVN